MCLPDAGNHAGGPDASSRFHLHPRRVLAHWYGLALASILPGSYPAAPDLDRLAKGPTRDDRRRIEPEAATNVAPTKPPKLNTAAFKAVPETARAARRGPRRGRGVLQDARQVEAAHQGIDAARWPRGCSQSLGLGEQYLGFTMVMLANEFWREQVAAIPFNRRLLLLPHCLKNAEGCPADYDEFGLDCNKCGACSRRRLQDQGRGPRLQGAGLAKARRSS